MTMAAAIWRPDPTPPAASTGRGATASITSGHSTMEPTSPVCPPPSDPWQMTMSTPAALWFNACFTEPARAAINIPCSCTCSITSSGGVPSALATSATLSWRRMTSTSGAAVAAVQPSSSRRGPPSISGTPWSARIFLAKVRCSSGIIARSSSSSLTGSSSPMPSYLPGMTMSTP